MKSTRHTPSVTSLPEAPQDEAKRRVRHYAITMGIRAVSVILAVCLLHVIPLWLDLGLAVLGTFLPGFAVVMANDRPAKKPLFPHRFDPRPDRALESKPHGISANKS